MVEHARMRGARACTPVGCAAKMQRKQKKERTGARQGEGRAHTVVLGEARDDHLRVGLGPERAALQQRLAKVDAARVHVQPRAHVVQRVHLRHRLGDKHSGAPSNLLWSLCRRGARSPCPPHYFYAPLGSNDLAFVETWLHQVRIDKEGAPHIVQSAQSGSRSADV